MDKEILPLRPPNPGRPLHKEAHYKVTTQYLYNTQTLIYDENLNHYQKLFTRQLLLTC